MTVCGWGCNSLTLLMFLANLCHVIDGFNMWPNVACELLNHLINPSQKGFRRVVRRRRPIDPPRACNHLAFAKAREGVKDVSSSAIPFSHVERRRWTFTPRSFCYVMWFTTWASLLSTFMSATTHIHARDIPMVVGFGGSNVGRNFMLVHFTCRCHWFLAIQWPTNQPAGCIN